MFAMSAMRVLLTIMNRTNSDFLEPRPHRPRVGHYNPLFATRPGAKPLPRESNSRRRSSDVETAQAGHGEIGKHDLRMAAASDVEPSSQSEAVRMSRPDCASAFENVP